MDYPESFITNWFRPRGLWRLWLREAMHWCIPYGMLCSYRMSEPTLSCASWIWQRETHFWGAGMWWFIRFSDILYETFHVCLVSNHNILSLSLSNELMYVSKFRRTPGTLSVIDSSYAIEKWQKCDHYKTFFGVLNAWMSSQNKDNPSERCL